MNLQNLTLIFYLLYRLKTLFKFISLKLKYYKVKNKKKQQSIIIREKKIYHDIFT